MKDITRKKIILYIKKHPLTKFRDIYQNASTTKNHNSLKKYLKELVKDGSIIYISMYDEYLIQPIPDEFRNGVLIKLGVGAIIQEINKLDVATKTELKNIENNYDFELENFNVKNRSLRKQVLFKFYKSLPLVLNLLKTEGEIIKKTNLMKGGFFIDVEQVIKFEEKFLDFLDEYDKISKEKLKKLDLELNQIYQTDIEYALKIWKGKMPMNEIVTLGIVENIAGIKEASKTHLKIRKTSKNREYGEIEEGRIYPRKLTSTNRRISELYTQDKNGEKIPDIDKIMIMFQSELGRQGVNEVSKEKLDLFALTFVLGKFLNDNRKMTPEELKNKKKVEKIFSKLLSPIS